MAASPPSIIVPSVILMNGWNSFSPLLIYSLTPTCGQKVILGNWVFLGQEVSTPQSAFFTPVFVAALYTLVTL